MSEWTSISERLPDNRLMVLLIAIKSGPNQNYTTDMYCGWRDGFEGWARWPHKFMPTHWMPLPEPPK